MYKSTVPPTYRGRNQMNLVEFIEDVEKCHFRTGHDTGSNRNALFVWNILRNYAGLDSLELDDLIQRHADGLGWTLDEMKEDYRQLEAMRREL